MDLPLDEARRILEAVRTCAEALNKPMTAAVVDAGGYVIALERMDGARPLQPSIATAKAYTAAVMQRPAVMLKSWADSQPGFFAQVARMGHQPVVATEGGVPIKKAGRLIGGLGVAGGTGAEDQQVCEEVLSALGYELDFETVNRIRR